MFTPRLLRCFFFFFNDTATTEIYTLSLHDALPISLRHVAPALDCAGLGEERHQRCDDQDGLEPLTQDRKSTRLNSSHSQISYAVFCLKKKKNSIDSTQLSNLPHISARCRPILRPRS